MSQVVIEFTAVAASRGGTYAPVSSFFAQSEEITSSASSQSTTLAASGSEEYNIVTVINNGTDTIWVNFGQAATAASPSRMVPPNTIRDFGGIKKGDTVSVINDS